MAPLAKKKDKKPIYLGSVDITSTRWQASPPENIEIHTQKPESGGSGDGGGIIAYLSWS